MKTTFEEAFDALTEQQQLDHGGHVSRSPDAYDPVRALITPNLLG